MTTDRLLSLREPAAAEITPEKAAAYLTARAYMADYGRRMVEAVNLLAEIEGQSPLAVWAEMV